MAKSGVGSMANRRSLYEHAADNDLPSSPGRVCQV